MAPAAPGPGTQEPQVPSNWFPSWTTVLEGAQVDRGPAGLRGNLHDVCPGQKAAKGILTLTRASPKGPPGDLVPAGPVRERTQVGVLNTDYLNNPNPHLSQEW